jgi:very-short-patch-repair endonuclease
MAHTRWIHRSIDGKSIACGFDALISWLAGHQHGVVARFQLNALGVSDDAIDFRIEAGRLHPLHRGVYSVGHRNVSAKGHRLAAVLACGEAAVLSHASAAAHWGIRPTSAARVDVTAPTIHRRRGIKPHRSKLRPDEVTVHDGIPITTVARTLLDLGAVLNDQALEKTINEAEIRDLFDLDEIDALLARYPRRKGTKAFRRAIKEAKRRLTRTRSDLEDRFKALLFAENLPEPEYNATLELNGTTYEPDCLWREQRLIVELDSRTFHQTTAAFEQDRERDRIFTAAGYRVIRVTWRHLDNPKPVFDDLDHLLQATSTNR